MAETGGLQGIRDYNLLLSAIGRPQASFSGGDLYLDIFSKAAALIDSLIRNHPFVDGNKRTGAASAGLFLKENGLILNAPQEELVQFTLKVAQSKLSIQEMAAWFKQYSEPAQRKE